MVVAWRGVRRLPIVVQVQTVSKRCWVERGRRRSTRGHVSSPPATRHSIACSGCVVQRSRGKARPGQGKVEPLDDSTTRRRG